MTEISQLQTKINLNPSYLGQIDWRDETDWFSKERIKQLIIGIEDNEVCSIAGEMIISSWYLACKEDEYDGFNPKRSLKDEAFEDYYVWRFCTSLNESSSYYDHSIEKFIADICGIREETIIQRNRLKKLEGKARQIKHKKPKFIYEEDGEVFEVNGEDVLMFHFDRQNRWLKEQLEVCEKKISSLESDYNSLKESYEKATSEWEEKTKALSEDVEKTLEQAKVEAVRELVKQIVIYAEGFPANENAKADTIKEMLLAKAFNGHIPNEAFDENLRKCIDALGRKEMGINMTAKSMFEVTGNQKVVIGNGQNG